MQELTIHTKTEDIQARVANTFYTRFKGLMGEESLPQGKAMIFDANSIHMLFMKFPIDAVFLDKNCAVISIHKHMQPWKDTATCLQASYVIEMPDGEADRLRMEIGDKVEIKK